MSASKRKPRYHLTFAEKCEKAFRLTQPKRTPCWGGKRKRIARAK